MAKNTPLTPDHSHTETAVRPTVASETSPGASPKTPPKTPPRVLAPLRQGKLGLLTTKPVDAPKSETVESETPQKQRENSRSSILHGVPNPRFRSQRPRTIHAACLELVTPVPKRRRLIKPPESNSSPALKSCSRNARPVSMLCDTHSPEQRSSVHTACSSPSGSPPESSPPESFLLESILSESSATVLPITTPSTRRQYGRPYVAPNTNGKLATVNLSPEAPFHLASAPSNSTHLKSPSLAHQLDFEQSTPIYVPFVPYKPYSSIALTKPPYFVPLPGPHGAVFPLANIAEWWNLVSTSGISAKEREELRAELEVLSEDDEDEDREVIVGEHCEDGDGDGVIHDVNAEDVDDRWEDQDQGEVEWRIAEAYGENPTTETKQPDTVEKIISIKRAPSILWKADPDHDCRIKKANSMWIPKLSLQELSDVWDENVSNMTAKDFDSELPNESGEDEELQKMNERAHQKVKTERQEMLKMMKVPMNQEEDGLKETRGDATGNKKDQDKDKKRKSRTFDEDFIEDDDLEELTVEQWNEISGKEPGVK